MSIRITIEKPSVALTWEIYDWHFGPRLVSYYPTIDHHKNTAHYDFEDRDDAMRFKLAFGGKIVETDN